PTPMGWQSRAWFLGPHAPALFDTNGNIGPSIWADGRIVGGWAQRPDGEVVTRLLEDVSPETRKLIDTEIDRTTTWFGTTRAIPRFRTPLQRELTA
ncbi:DNA glycosylase AlkZ-like family protein, partial [Nocardia sp. GTS18]